MTPPHEPEGWETSLNELMDKAEYYDHDELVAFIQETLKEARLDERRKMRELLEGMRKWKHDDIPGVFVAGSEHENAPLVDCSATEAACYTQALTDAIARLTDKDAV